MLSYTNSTLQVNTMFGLHEKKKRWDKSYKKAVSENLPERSRRFYKRIKIVTILVLLCNYLASFSSAYAKMYPLIPKSLIDFYTYPSLNRIQEDMTKFGDIELFNTYAVFTFLNINICLIVFILSIFRLKINKTVRYYFEMGICYTATIFLFLIVIVSVLFINDAGYGNSRFPIYSRLGQGVFFFIRDTVMFYVVAFSLIELLVMRRLLVRKKQLGDGIY